MRERGVEPPVLSGLPARPVTYVAAGFVPVQLPPALIPLIHLELRRGAAVIKIEWPTSSAQPPVLPGCASG